MAGTDPRRSSRARTNQSQNSSAASSTSGRSERNTRSVKKAGSSQKSTSASLSSEPPEDTLDEPPNTRQRKRTLRLDKDNSSKADSYDMAINDEIQEDDEVVRCVCGYEDYPGPPPFDYDSKHGRDLDSEPISASEMTEDLAGFYLQCDLCNVWQHGACFGITDDASTPKEYFCETCKPSLHKVFTASNGQRYSSFLPLKRSLRTSSRASSHAKDGTRSPQEITTKAGRVSSASQTTKRRATMNSRYDEEEQIRLAIEASKEDALPEQLDPPTKRSKRVRSDSEEKHEHVKRQRTDSRSASPGMGNIASPTREDSTDTTTTRNGSLSKKSRTTANRNHREKTERDDRERLKAEATKKRGARAERRRAEGMIPVLGHLSHKTTDCLRPAPDSPLDEPLCPTSTTTSTSKIIDTPKLQQPSPPPGPPPPAAELVEAQVSQPSPDTPPSKYLPTNNSSHKKSARATHKKSKGRSHHSKDREEHEGSPTRPQSKDTAKAVQENSHTSAQPAKSDHSKGNHHQHHNGKHSKSSISSKVSIADMNRRANIIMDYITRTQLDMAGEAYTPRHTNRRSGGVAHHLLTPNCGDAPQHPPAAPSTVGSAPVGATKATTDGEEKAFKELNSVEMMDHLTRQIIQWQKAYYPEIRS